MKSTTLLILLLVTVPSFFYGSCKKKKEATPVIVPYVDTAGLLAAHGWYVDYIWTDNNDNQVKDYPVEIASGLLSFHVYKFISGGTFTDSIPGHTLPGTWYFKGVTKDSVYINVSGISYSLHSILSITDSTLATKRWGTAEYWYFVKY